MWFGVVETVDDPRQALALARTLGPRVLVTGSLYLLADLYLLAETGRDE
jgi:folylpolyglutamate synthase/dihydropteroate synthase